jgi:signal transduction histidine kinase
MIYRYLITLLLVCMCLDTTAQEPLLHTPEEAALLQKIKNEKIPDSLCDYYDMLGAYYFNNGYFAKAQEHFLTRLKIAEQLGLKRTISATCNNIASVYNEMGKPDEAIPFIERAIKEVQGLKNNTILLSNYYMTLGNAHYIKYMYKEAIADYEQSLKLVLNTRDSLEAGAVYRNIGAAFQQSGNAQMAVNYFKKSLQYRILSRDTAKIFYSYCGIADMYNIMHRYDSAAVYLAYCAPLLPYVSDALYMMREYHYALYAVYSQTGKLQQALDEQIAYHKFKDSIVNEDNLSALSDEKNKYLLEKKDLEVTRHRELAVREKRMRILLSVVLVLAIVSLAAFIFWLRVRQRAKLVQEQLKRQEGERNMLIEGQESERRRIARELHDGLVQELTAIVLNLQTREEVNRADLIEKVTQAAREARNIAHQMMPVSLMHLGLISALEDLFQQTYPLLGIGYEFEHFTETEALSDAVSVSLYRICQELVANSVKHAGATLVHILIRQTASQIILVFEDNGKGFDVSLTRKGIGMVSISTRVQYLNGELSFDTADGAGTTAIVKIPLHSTPATGLK